MKSVLAVGAHPDDIEFGCPITIKRFIQKDYDAYYIILTNGENGFKSGRISKAGRISIRKKEQINASAMLGVKKVYFFGEKDGFLRYSDEVKKMITLLIKKLKPEIIFTFDPGNTRFDNLNLFHRDHRETALMVFDACFAAKNAHIYPCKYGLHRISKLYLFGTDKPDHFEDITDEMDYKMEVLKCFKSQFPDFKAFRKFFIKNFTKYTKYTKKYKHSEAFRVVEVKKMY